MENNIHDKRITKRKKLTTDYHPSSWAVKQSSQIFRTLFKTLSAASFVDVEIRNEKQFLAQADRPHSFCCAAQEGKPRLLLQIGERKNKTDLRA